MFLHICDSSQGGILRSIRCLLGTGGRCSGWCSGLVGFVRKAGRVLLGRRFAVMMASIGPLLVGWLAGLQNRTSIQDVTF